MKLRYYAAFVTWTLAIILITAGMWVFTKKDVLEIYVVALMFSPMFPLAVMAFTETEEPDETRKEVDWRRHRRKYFRIYTLKEENSYGRKIS